MQSNAPASFKRPFYLRWPFGLAVGVVITYGVAFAMHWDDRAALWIKEGFESTAERSESVWLPDYTVDIDAKPLPAMADYEASDLAYNPSTRTLFAVMGKQPFLTELNLEGDVLRNIPLNGWANPEGVTVMDGGYLAITDERLHDLTVVKVDATTTVLNHADFPSHDLGARKHRCPVIRSTCETCRRWALTRERGTCWRCLPTPTCCWNWTSRVSRSAS